ncbi:MAG: acetylglutamate kinase [Cyclobacteriaceae bacterium]
MDTLNVIKIGGNIIDSPKELQDFLASFSKLEGHNILVHGGGKTATHMADLLQLKTKMIDGRRITDDQTIDVVTMTYGGLINKQIVSQLQSLGTNALGLTGADGNLISANKRPEQNGIDYGWVGDPTSVNANWMDDLIRNGLVPVIAPLTHDGYGNILNTNADTIASVIAIAMSDHFEVSLTYCFELNGVLKKIDDPGSVIRELTQDSYESYKQDGSISSGMIPKLDNAFEAIKGGVKSVQIMSWKSISNLQKMDSNEYTSIK